MEQKRLTVAIASKFDMISKTFFFCSQDSLLLNGPSYHLISMVECANRLKASLKAHVTLQSLPFSATLLMIEALA